MPIQPVELFIIAAIALFAVMCLVSAIFIVEQQTVSIVTRFGKFKKSADAGLNFKLPFIDQVVGAVSLRVQQLDIPVETKTKDNVFLKLSVSVQFLVKSDSIYDAFYRLTNPESQITSYIFDVVRAQVPKLELDDVFEKKDNIANAVQTDLSDQMSEFGYNIIKALVTDVDPDAKVKSAMNEINEQARLRMAAEQKGEASKIIRVKQAEAEAESLKLQGQGIAEQRKAIVEGLKESIHEFQKDISGTSATEVMNLVLVTQYYDALKEIGANNKSTTVILPGTPDASHSFSKLLQQGIISGNIASESSTAG
jgi:regulator of protease activity HflC (stomatin/prohibitin superfamily)